MYNIMLCHFHQVTSEWVEVRETELDRHLSGLQDLHTQLVAHKWRLGTVQDKSEDRVERAKKRRRVEDDRDYRQHIVFVALFFSN